MPALASDIVRATRQARVIQREDAQLLATYPTARDSLKDPQPGYFEFAADAVKVLDISAALIGRYCRRFVVAIGDEVEVDPLTEIPTFRLVDEELAADCDIMVARVEIDDEAETTSIEGIG